MIQNIPTVFEYAYTILIREEKEKIAILRYSMGGLDYLNMRERERECIYF